MQINFQGKGAGTSYVVIAKFNCKFIGIKIF
jgi:hypothetical protein